MVLLRAVLLAATIAQITARTLPLCLSASGLDPIIAADGSSYTNASLAFNRRYTFEPAAVVYPESAQQVSAAVQCAQSYSIPVQARCGGHSYGGYGLGGQNGSLVVSLDRLNSIEVDPGKRRATIGGGNRLGDIYLALAARNQTIAAGTCPYVGIGGHALHGGFGILSRKLGLAMDQIVEMQVVTADGRIKRVSKNHLPDLFYGLRGAGSSFGIVTSFTLRTHPTFEHNVYYEVNAQFDNATQAAQAFYDWQNFVYETPADFYGGISLGGNGLQFTMDGAYFGDDGIAGLNATLAPLLAKWGANASMDTLHDGTFIETAEWFARWDGALNTTTAPDTSDNFFATSIIVQEDNVLTLPTLQNFFEHLVAVATNINYFIEIDLYGGKHSAIGQIAANATAFPWRNALWTAQIYAESANNTIGFVHGVKNAITGEMPEVDFKGYVNYLDTTLTAPQAHHQYYGADATRRLKVLKKKYDPRSLFQNPQSFGSHKRRL